MKDMSRRDVDTCLAVLLYGGFPVFVEQMNDGGYTITISTEDGHEVLCRSVGEVIQFFKDGEKYGIGDVE